MSHLKLVAVIFLLALSCSDIKYNNNTFYDRELTLFSDSISFNSDSLYFSDFFIDYSHIGFYLTDLKYQWKSHFSDKYFDVYIKYADSSYVLVYCAVSGIMNGYLLFPKKYRHTYLFKRSNGEQILDVKSEEPIESGKIKGDTLFLKCYNPDVVRFVKFKK